MPSSSENPGLATLYNDNHNWLFHWLRKRMGCAHDAADLAQDTFVRLLTAPGAGQQISAIREPRSFLATIAQRVLVDRIRRRAIEQAYLDALAVQPEQCAPSPETRAVIIESLLEIDQMLDGLGARTRQIFLMAQLDGCSYVEIGRRLNLSVTTVRKHFIKAITACLLLIED